MRRVAPIKVAIIGGGCASITAAFELSRPEHRGKYQVTVYQLGWRLGGKGASGRGVADRIEEHGLHLWMGYYENAFRLMRECYDELERDPEICPVARWTDAFSPSSFNGVMDGSPEGGWLPWTAELPAAAGMPGDPVPRYRAPSVVEYLARTLDLAVTVLRTLRHRMGNGDGEAGFVYSGQGGPARLLDDVARLARYGGVLGIGGMLEALRLMKAFLHLGLFGSDNSLLGALDVLTRASQSRLAEMTARDPELSRLWQLLDLALAVIRGTLRSRLATDPRGFDAIDHLDYREWLAQNGASRAALEGSFLRALYDLVFAYEDGDVQRPRIAAGQAARGAFRGFFAYRGAFFWKMSAGMGDIVFAPLYEVLRRRGVRFDFFHRLRHVGLDGTKGRARPHVASLRFDVQAHVAGGRPYQPLRDVRGLPSWPSEPDYTQLVDGDQLRVEGRAFERHWDDRRVGQRSLRVGKDFDMVVLGVGLGAVPYVCSEIVAFDPRWRAMIEHVKTVGTQAFQIWTSATARDLGWTRGPVNVSGFVEPFDTWADMTHVAPAESWPRRPGMISYFCSVLPGSGPEGANSREAFAAVSADVRRNAMTFLDREARHLWPNAIDERGGFRWELLLDSVDPRRAKPRGPARFHSQYWRANVDPSDRYVLSLPGTTQYRVSPLDQTYDNMAVAGDWTDNSLNMGCVEAAVMSGRLAAHALAQSPRLGDIVGFDHP